jgi:NADH:ubiquinone oxidoreductase subunit D
MVKILLAVNLYQIIYIGGVGSKLFRTEQYLPYVTQWDYCATMFAEAIKVNAPKRSIGKYVSQRASYSRVIMLKLGRIVFFFIAWFFSWRISMLKLFILIFKTPFSSIFGDRDMIYDLFLLQVCE